MNKNLVGHKVKYLNSEKSGIVLQIDSRSEESMIEKYAISLDNDIKIERVTQEVISFGEKVADKVYFGRVIRDIQSQEELTREHSSEILCDYIEFRANDVDLSTLELGIEKIIEQIKVESNINAEHKLVEGLFEFIWLKKIAKEAETELLERLTDIDKYYVWSYLGDQIREDIESYDSKKLKAYYFKNKEKWEEKDVRMYGQEKRAQYYDNINKTSG